MNPIAVIAQDYDASLEASRARRAAKDRRRMRRLDITFKAIMFIIMVIGAALACYAWRHALHINWKAGG